MLTSNSIFWKIFSIFWQIFLSFLQIFSIFWQIFSIFWQIFSIYWQIYSIFWPFFFNILTKLLNPLTNIFNILTNLDKIRSIAECPQEFWYTFQSFKQLRKTPRKLDSLEKQCWEDNQQRENRQKMWVVIRSEVFGTALRKTSMWNHWLDLRGGNQKVMQSFGKQNEWVPDQMSEI